MIHTVALYNASDTSNKKTAIFAVKITLQVGFRTQIRFRALNYYVYFPTFQESTYIVST